MAANIPPTSSKYNDYLKDPNPNSLFFAPTNEYEIYNIISDLKVTSPTTSSDFPVQLLIRYASYLALPLAHLINQSITLGIVPDLMKIAKVIPIFKTGSSQDMTNYRPISTLTSFSKILEKIVQKRLYDFLDTNQILYDNQFGFRRNHSTALAVIENIDQISETMDSRKQTLQGVFFDPSKAFDSIRLDILLDKLSHYGIRGLPLEWFRSFLTNRFQFVSYAGSISDLLPILSGVPQGSILGPLLFYINDVSHSSKTLNFILFADDTSAFLSSSTVLHLFQDMTLELNHLSTGSVPTF